MALLLVAPPSLWRLLAFLAAFFSCCIAPCQPIKLKDWENEVLERQGAVTKPPKHPSWTIHNAEKVPYSANNNREIHPSLEKNNPETFPSYWENNGKIPSVKNNAEKLPPRPKSTPQTPRVFHHHHASPKTTDSTPPLGAITDRRGLEKTADGLREVVRYGEETSQHGVSTHEANKPRTKVSVVHYPGGRLLGPALHGPDWSVHAHPPVSSASSLEGTFLWAVGLLGTVQNTATVITVLSSKRCRRPLHILVGCLALTDLFISVIYIPSYTYFLLETLPVQDTPGVGGVSSDTQGELWSICVISRTVFIQIASVTLTIKALIAGYLYMYTTSKQTAERVFTFQNTVLLILVAWFFNFLVLFLPSIIGFEQVDFYPNAMLCYKTPIPKPNSQDVQLPFCAYLLSTLTLHSIELMIMCICFIRVHCAINTGKRIWLKKCTIDIQDRPDAIMYNRATKTTVLLFISFTVCWLPIYIINLLDPLHERFPDYAHHVCMDLLLLKSAINPGIYIYGIRSLRRELQIMCMCRCRDPNARNLKFKAPLTSTFYSGEEEEEEGGEGGEGGKGKEEKNANQRTMSPIKAV